MVSIPCRYINGALQTNEWRKSSRHRFWISVHQLKLCTAKVVQCLWSVVCCSSGCARRARDSLQAKHRMNNEQRSKALLYFTINKEFEYSRPLSQTQIRKFLQLNLYITGCCCAVKIYIFCCIIYKQRALKKIKALFIHALLRSTVNSIGQTMLLGSARLSMNLVIRSTWHTVRPESWRVALTIFTGSSSLNRLSLQLFAHPRRGRCHPVGGLP